MHEQYGIILVVIPSQRAFLEESDSRFEFIFSTKFKVGIRCGTWFDDW